MRHKIVYPALFLLVFTLTLAAQPYALFVSFDGFRWDYLNRGLTPNLDKLKESGVYTLSLQPSFPSKTFPNHQSIITGMYPAHHGIIANSFTDRFNKGMYRMQDSTTVRDGRWYLGEAFWETAERQGIRTASYFWPGSELELAYRRPSIYKKYSSNRDYESRISEAVNWLTLPEDTRPHFITLYFEILDDVGHSKGPESKEINEAIKKADELVGQIINKLKEIKMDEQVNLIILSDHGMTEVSEERSINIENLLSGHNCELGDSGPTMMVYPPKDKLEEVYEILKKNEKNYKAYYRDEIPAYYNFSDHPFISPIYLVADMGWSLTTNRARRSGYSSKGNHGFDNHHLDMHGIFVASGPNFKSGYKAGTIKNVDIYPLLCRLFNIIPRANIDGKLENVEFLLR